MAPLRSPWLRTTAAALAIGPLGLGCGSGDSPEAPSRRAPPTTSTADAPLELAPPPVLDEQVVGPTPGPSTEALLTALRAIDVPVGQLSGPDDGSDCALLSEDESTTFGALVAAMDRDAQVRTSTCTPGLDGFACSVMLLRSEGAEGEEFALQVAFHASLAGEIDRRTLVCMFAG